MLKGRLISLTTVAKGYLPHLDDKLLAFDNLTHWAGRREVCMSLHRPATNMLSLARITIYFYPHHKPLLPQLYCSSTTLYLAVMFNQP